ESTQTVDPWRVTTPRRHGYYWKPSTRRTHFFLREKDGVVYIVSSPKVASIIERSKDVLTLEDGAELINIHLQHGSTIDTASGSSYHVCVSDKVIKPEDV